MQFGDEVGFQLDINLRTLALAFQPVSSAQARWLTRERVIVLFWVAAITTVIVMANVGPAGWDARISWTAIQSVRQGADPYASGIAEQQTFRQLPASRRAERLPLPGARRFFDYPPLTLTLLRLLSGLPDGLLALLYWSAVAGGFLLQLGAGFQLADEAERRWLALLLPAVAFFPGLITDDAILSGNVSYILYGLVLAAAVPGWKRSQWFWYYIAVVAASIVKPPSLTLLALPVLLDKRQWLRSASTAIAALFLFAASAQMWPELFREHLRALQTLFDVGADFGYGPVGVIGRALWDRGWPYSPATTILYVTFAAALGLVLLFMAYHVRHKNLSRDAWIPVALVGTFLLNPRIMKYDMAVITIPMLLIASRGLRALLQSQTENLSESSNSNRLLFVGAACFLIPNLLTVFGPTWWPVELIILLTTFALGAWALLRTVPEIHPEEIPSFVPDPIGEPAFEISAVN